MLSYFLLKLIGCIVSEMNYNAGRPVVVNSLLCFLKNYRDQNNILQIIDQHFTLDSRRLSYQILLELLSENDKLAVVSSSVSPSLLELFDRVSQSNIVLPIFATDDLTVLPLSLNYEDGVEQPKDLYSEVKQLRFYVHNALGQKTYNSYPWKRYDAFGFSGLFIKLLTSITLRKAIRF